MIEQHDLKAPLKTKHERGVSIQAREAEGKQTIFIMNFTEDCQTVHLEETVTDCLLGEDLAGTFELKPYETRIVKKVK